jgi:hypothetical protein
MGVHAMPMLVLLRHVDRIILSLVCVYEKDIHVSHKGQGAATDREKGQGVTRIWEGAVPCKNGLARTL